jgi:hypothetical protein
MKRVLARIDSFWGTNPYLALLLIVALAGPAVWTRLHPQSPGFSIGFLALAAGIMSLRPKMHFLEKVAWVILMVTFTYQEVKAIKQNDLNNEAIRDSQNAAFGAIVDDLKISIKNSKEQYTRTLDHVDRASDHLDGVATTTQKIADLARINLEDVTGGDSFAYVYPTEMLGSNQMQLLKIHNAGNQPLNVTLTMTQVVQDVGGEGCNEEMANRSVVQVGTIAPHDGRTLPNGAFNPSLNVAGMALYQIYINAQNSGASERLQFRRPSNGGDLEFKMDVLRPVTGRTKRGDVKLCGASIRYLKRVDWRSTKMQGTLEQNTK